MLQDMPQFGLYKLKTTAPPGFGCPVPFAAKGGDQDENYQSGQERFRPVQVQVFLLIRPSGPRANSAGPPAEFALYRPQPNFDSVVH